MATITVTNSNDSGAGSLRAALAAARNGDTINFAPSVTTIDLDSSLVISKNVTIEGSQPGSTTPGVTVNGGGTSSNFSDFIINSGVSAKIDGLIIADGNATGTAGGAGKAGSNSAGGILDNGVLTLSDSILKNDTSTGGAGGNGGKYQGGGAGGSAAGGIYVSATGSLDLLAGDSFSNDSATGGHGGSGGSGQAFFKTHDGGAGGAGGVSGVNGGAGSPGADGFGLYGGAGGAAGHNGGNGGLGFFVFGPGGGGGGGNAFGDVGGQGKITGNIPCYCGGTLIATKDGDKRVEDLAVGDEVVTLSGALRPIKWMGRRSYNGRFIRDNKDILPVCIKAGALDDNVPQRDLWVSPHHAMYVDGVLIEAKDLVNAASIVQAERADTVEYFHVELDTHDVIIAEGALSETYLDDDNRTMFHNAHDFETLYPAAAAVTPYCAPRLEDGYEVEHVRQRLALRAGVSRTPSRAAG